MAPVTLARRLEFIESLELPHYEPRLRATFVPPIEVKGGEKDGYVDDGGLVSFVAGVSAPHQTAALHSALLAQLSASKLFDREKDTGGWYHQYLNVLEHCGWAIQAFDFQRYQATGSTVVVAEAVLGVLAAIASQNELLILRETMEALKKLSAGDGRLLLWDAASHQADAGNFQVALGTESNGLMSLKLGCFRFKSTEHATRFLWFSYHSSTMELYKGAQTITLDDKIYGEVAAQIASKLGARARSFIADLDI